MTTTADSRSGAKVAQSLTLDNLEKTYSRVGGQHSTRSKESTCTSNPVNWLRYWVLRDAARRQPFG